MKQISMLYKLSSIALISLFIAACGGGGDVAGDTTDFSTNPDEWKVTSTGCSGGAQVFVTIVGGQPPYRIHNPHPAGLLIDRTEASGKDPRFKITTLGGCMDTVPVLVLDYHSRSTTVKITVEEPS